MGLRRKPVYSVKAGAPGRPASERIDLTHLVLSVSYEDDETKTDKCSISVNNHDLSQISAPHWFEGNSLEVSWGYADGMSPAREVVIQKRSGGRVLKVEANDKGALLHKERKRRAFEQVTYSEIVTTIAAEYGYTDTRWIQETKEVFPFIVQANETDAQLLRKICDKSAFVWFVDFDGFHFHAPDTSQRPIRSFVYYLGDERLGDIVDWSFEAAQKSSKAGNVKVEHRDPDEKEDTEVELNRNTVKDEPALSPLAYVIDPRDLTIDPAAAVIGTSATSTTAALEKKADAAAAVGAAQWKKSQRDAVNLTLTVWGDPLVVAKSVIEVQQLGELSGLWYVTSAKHDLVGTDVYKLALKCKRDGVSGGGAPLNAFDQQALPGQGGGVPTTGPQNEQKAPAPSEEADQGYTIDPRTLSISPTGSARSINTRK